MKACLAKDPDARRQSAHDVAEDLRAVAQAGDLPGRSASRTRRRGWILGPVALLIVLVAIVLLFGSRQDWWSPRSVRTDLVFPAGQTLGSSAGVGVAFAPGGSALVYHALDRVQLRCHLNWQTLDGSPPRDIPGAVGGEQPFFSPDGRYLGFALGEKLVKLALPSGHPGDAGGPVEPLADIGLMRGATWGEDGSILFTPRPHGGLWRVSADGGGARELTKPDLSRNELSHRWPCFLPGGRAALFTLGHASGRQDRSAIAVLSLDTGKWHRIIEHGCCARYMPTGHVVFARNRALLAVRFDPSTLTTIGQPVPVATGVFMVPSGGTGFAAFDVSASGSIVFARAPGPQSSSTVDSTKGTLTWLDRQGRVEPVTSDARAYGVVLDLSPDGQKLAVSIGGPEYENLHVYHLRERRWQQFATENDEKFPVWSAKGDRLAFASNRDGAFNLYVMQSDGEGRAERLTWSPNWQFPCSWSRDGRFIAYQEQDRENGWSIWILPVDGDRKPWRWGPDGPDGFGFPIPTFSPDGRWLAYQSEETGEKVQVQVRPFPGPGPRTTASGSEGGLGPVWSPDGKEILFQPASDTDNRVLGVDVSRGPTLRFTNPHVAFGLPFAAYFDRFFALSPDGRRLVTVRPETGYLARISSLTLIRNWADEVKAKVGR